ncbi:MAG TPA: extracellular solute-binding protein [Stellaceae bacterium]|nr:extracellular solute-binding protein [Stellaceae bacterium]
MKRGLGAAARLVLLPACLALPRVASAQPSWDEVVKAAKAEGEVDVHGGPGKVYEEVLTTGFKAAYPDIKLNFVGTSGRDVILQIEREREAGLYRWDVYVGGTPSILQTLKPAGDFAPLRPALILPEVTDDKAWRDGFDAGWMDKEKKYTFAFDYTFSPLALVNWDVVSHDDLKTFADLLKPQFAGKIVWDDPRLPGEGLLVGQVLLKNFGADFLTKLFATQKIVFLANRRQEAENVVRGTTPIGMAVPGDEVGQFQAQGLGKSILPFNGDAKALSGDTGFGTVSLMDKAPHPNAAKVYINWLLSKAGQTDWTKTERNSRRLDVPPGAPSQEPPPGMPYSNLQSEDQIPIRDQVVDIAKKNIPADNH